jgi:hypothetical protein
MDGKPITNGIGTIEVNSAVIEALEKALQLAWAGEIDQVIIVGVGDTNLNSDIMIAGRTKAPEIMYTYLSAVQSEYMEEFLKPKIFGYEVDYEDE